MDEITLQLLIDLHRANDRQGPGGDAETKLALRLAGLDRSRRWKVADIGCGTGASTIPLARELDAEITAVDFLPAFLEELEARAKNHGVADKITPLQCSMDALPFSDGELDVIWSEGAIYNMGFAAGVAAWRRFLKPGGMLCVSEITWLSAERPSELEAHWQAQYPEIDVASAKIRVLEQHGYKPTAYFYLPEPCWTDNYYQPLQRGFEAFLERHERSEKSEKSDRAKAIVADERAEIALYDTYRQYYSYGFYLAEKV